ncbi:MAG TPA: DUF3048 domain-containing protein [Pseudonocardiaceae bacterium]
MTVAVAAVLVGGLATAAVLVANHRSTTTAGSQPPAVRTSVAPTTTAPVPPSPVLAVKIDNVAGARPQTGVGAANVVYVELVEGGLTRLMAVYSGNLPPAIGPVRSARRTDLDLLAQYGRPTLAYSGAAQQILTLLHGAPLVNASPTEADSAYYRGNTHAAPHNLYVQPAKLPPAAAPPPATLRFGPAPPGGIPTATQRVSYPAAVYDFTWSATTGRWLVSMDGTPDVTTDSGQLSAATVVIQHVMVHADPADVDVAGNPGQVSETVGTGSATVLRDGQSFAATWSRPTAPDSTRYTTTSGTPLPLSAGPVWILLVPA